MSITGSIVLYVILWWIIFFSILPLDVNRVRSDNIKANDPGAPENTKLLKKVVITTLFNTIIFVVIYLLVKYEYLNIRNLIT